MSKFYQATHIGNIRKHNEDSLAVIEPETYVVADGMGGHAAGEIASNMLVENVKNILNSMPLPWNEYNLKEAIARSNEVIYEKSQNIAEYEGMGTTATILHIENQTAYYAHVGDSRIYRVKSDQLIQLTKDHSYVEELVRNGEISEVAARIHPMKNVLTQAVGAMPELNIDAGNFKVEDGDILLLCTDGLTNMVDDDTIKSIINRSANPAEDLISAALTGGGKDNISVIVVKYFS